MDEQRLALGSIAVVAVLAFGCTSPSSSFYTLNAVAVADEAAPASYSVAVGPVTVPELVDRPQFTVQVGPNRVEIDEFHRWAAPLRDDIARVVAADLSALLGTPQVAPAPMTNFEPAYRVTVQVQRFESQRSETMADGSALIEALWVVHELAGDATRAGRTVARESADGVSFDALAAAHSRALAKLSADIAAAIRAEVDTP